MRILRSSRGLLVAISAFLVLVIFYLRSSLTNSNDDYDIAGKDTEFRVGARPQSEGSRDQAPVIGPVAPLSPPFIASTVATTSTYSTLIAEAPTFSFSSSSSEPTKAVHKQEDSIHAELSDSTKVSNHATKPSISTTVKESQSTSTSLPSALILLKTGSQTVYRRLPLHLLTLLSGPSAPPYIIYSDAPAFLPPTHNVIDALENSTSHLEKHDPSAHAYYLEQKDSSQNLLYQSIDLLPGDPAPPTVDTAGLSRAWRLDRWKFLPMLSHAARTQSGFDWYIYLEDDSFIFKDTLLQYLATLNSTDVAYHGAYSGEGNATFAQGGSGIAFSSGLMRKLFAEDTKDGKMPSSLEKYGNMTASSCCGDMVLGTVLRDLGVQVNGGGYGELGFRPEPPWKIRWTENMMCQPVFAFHHLHAQDIARLWQLEKDVKEEKVNCCLVHSTKYHL